MSTAHPIHLNLPSEHDRLVEQLRRSRDELDHLVRALSHDMTANFMLLDSSFAQLKRSLHTASAEEVDQSVAHVEACLRESKRFLDDMVLLARTGRVPMEPTRVELEELVQEVLFEQRELLAERRVAVEVRQPLAAVWCNRQRLKQVVTNLIRNAVKHGCDPQQPNITVSAAPEGRAGEAGLRVRLVIHDNGPGIDPRFHEEMFLPGRRLPQAVGDGSGMGLAIVKKIVEHYGGTVRVDATCAAGTAIVVELPVPSGSPLPQPHYDARSEESRRRRPQHPGKHI